MRGQKRTALRGDDIEAEAQIAKRRLAQPSYRTLGDPTLDSSIRLGESNFLSPSVENTGQQNETEGDPDSLFDNIEQNCEIPLQVLQLRSQTSEPSVKISVLPTATNKPQQQRRHDGPSRGERVSGNGPGQGGYQLATSGQIKSLYPSRSPYPNDQYTVGWICAISTEFVAAQEFLDEEHGRPQSVATHDNNNYALGMIDRHYVVIAVLPHGEYGTSSAASVASDMLHSFPNIRVGLMVGIAGGVPSESHDIRLGDIVVSTPGNGIGGVFQYDYGQRVQDQGFQETGFLNQPPPLLRAAVNSLITDYERNGHQLEQAVNKIIQEKPRLGRKYARPDPGADKLFKPEITHSSSCASGCGDDASKLIHRPERTEEENLAIHYGLIASANQLMKDGKARDDIASKMNILCFEMEAAGLMNHFPCLVIRGICDYADSHKTKEWQGYAAMVAAAYAKDLLYRIVPTKLEAEKRIAERLSDVLDSVSRTEIGVSQMNRKLDQSKERAILDWLLCPIDYAAKQKDYINRKQPGTSQEFLNSEDFLRWLCSDMQTLFCPGIPGTGKTMVTSIVIDYLCSRFHNEPGIRIAYLYFEYARRDEQNLDTLFESLLKQLAQQQFEQTNSLPEGLKRLYDDYKLRQSRPTSHEFRNILLDTISSAGRTFIVVDALDECRDDNGCRSNFLSCIFELQSKTRLNLFATSRPDVVETQFRRYISREIRATKEDIYLYVDEQVSQWELSRKDTISDGLRDQIKKQVTAAAEEMFLLAYLNMTVLKEKATRRDIKEALRNLSKGERELRKAYDQMMERVESQGGELYKQILAWLFFTKRPLTSKELQHALTIRPGDTHLDDEGIPSVQTILSACAGLVRLDITSDIFDFAHGTAREYFNQTKPPWLTDAEKDIAISCVTYISFNTFGSESVTLSDFKRRCLLNPLFCYAARNWGHHVREASLQREQLIVSFLEHDDKVGASSEVMLGSRTGSLRHSHIFERKFKGMHLAARFGLRETIKTLCARKHDLDCKDPDGRTPLTWAIWKEQQSAVELLLELGADAQSRDRHGWTPLFWAMRTDLVAIAELLLKKGAKADCSDNNGQTALSWAVENGEEVVVKLLLDNNANIESKDQYDRAPLYLAVTKRDITMMSLLLDGGSSTECRTRNGQTPLLWAAEQGFTAGVQLLLDYKANIESEDHSGHRALSRAADNGEDAIIELLLAAGADCEFKDRFHDQTPLSWAAEKGHTTATELLLNNGADTESEDIFGRTPLSCAAESGHQATVYTLLCNGADPNSKDKKHGQTPLSWAAEKGNLGVVECLLGWGSYLESKDDYGWTPLSLAAWNKHTTVVEFLLNKGADFESKDRYGRTPLSWAAEIGHERNVTLFWVKGADVDLPDDFYQTPLSHAAENGRERVVKSLLDMGADPDLRDAYGQTPLSLATENRHWEVVNLFINHRAKTVSSLI